MPASNKDARLKKIDSTQNFFRSRLAKPLIETKPYQQFSYRLLKDNKFQRLWSPNRIIKWALQAQSVNLLSLGLDLE